MTSKELGPPCAMDHKRKEASHVGTAGFTEL